MLEEIISSTIPFLSIEKVLSLVTPILLIIFSITEYMYLLVLIIPLLIFTNSFIFLLVTSDFLATTIISELRALILILVSLYYFKDYDHNTTDFVNNLLYFTPVVIYSLFYRIITKKQENMIHMDIIYRYYLIIYLREIFKIDILVYLVQNIYYIQAFGYDIYDNLFFLGVFHFFGLIPCILLKYIDSFLH